MIQLRLGRGQRRGAGSTCGIAGASKSSELMNVKLRFKRPDADVSREAVFPVNDRTATSLTANLGFASAVAEFGMLLRGSKHAGQGTYDAAAARARKFRQEDGDGYRAEFVKLIELAASLRRLETASR